MSQAIWAKGGDAADALVHAFTVGDDWKYDRTLALYDVLGSIAHARMLGAVGLMPAADSAALCAGLRQLHGEYRTGGWTVEPTDEDVHSKVEALLTARLGEPGKKLHTGRSRNDQVLTDLRLWQRDELCALVRAALGTAAALAAMARRYEFHPLPGYTHSQRGMPSSVGLWAAAHAQSLTDTLALAEAAWALTERCPLGSGASYGVGLPLDRALTARLLGFGKPPGVAMADANGRGAVELAILDAAGGLLLHLNRLAADVVFFASQEAGFLRIGSGFTTGSSIMPQKRNPDVFELLRGRCATVQGRRTALAQIVHGLASGYSRDLQETKAAVIDGLSLARPCLDIAAAAVPTLEPVRDRILAALTPDIYATDAAYDLMRRDGIPFRDAYRIVGKDLAALSAPDHDATVRGRTHIGSTGNLGLAALDAEIAAVRAHWEQRHGRLTAAWDALLAG